MRHVVTIDDPVPVEPEFMMSALTAKVFVAFWQAVFHSKMGCYGLIIFICKKIMNAAPEKNLTHHSKSIINFHYPLLDRYVAFGSLYVFVIYVS